MLRLVFFYGLVGRGNSVCHRTGILWHFVTHTYCGSGTDSNEAGKVNVKSPNLPGAAGFVSSIVRSAFSVMQHSITEIRLTFLGGSVNVYLFCKP